MTDLADVQIHDSHTGTVIRAVGRTNFDESKAPEEQYTFEGYVAGTPDTVKATFDPIALQWNRTDG